MTMRQRYTVTKNEIKVPALGICIYPKCGNEDAHTHPRYNVLGWDMADPVWHAGMGDIFPQHLPDEPDEPVWKHPGSYV